MSMVFSVCLAIKFFPVIGFHADVVVKHVLVTCAMANTMKATDAIIWLKPPVGKVVNWFALVFVPRTLFCPQPSLFHWFVLVLTYRCRYDANFAAQLVFFCLFRGDLEGLWDVWLLGVRSAKTGYKIWQPWWFCSGVGRCLRGIRWTLATIDWLIDWLI